MKDTDQGTKRNPVAIRPALVSQHTAPAALGFKTPRAFLEWLAKSGCRFVQRGKDRLVRLEDAEEALFQRVLGVEEATADEAEPNTVGDVLARIGRRRTGGSP